MLNELVKKVSLEYRAKAFLYEGLTVDTGELSLDEIHSYIIFLIIARSKRSEKTSKGISISQKVKQSDEYKKIDTMRTLENSEAIQAQLDSLVRLETNRFHRLNIKNVNQSKNRSMKLRQLKNSARFKSPILVYDFQKEYATLMRIKAMENTSLKKTYNQFVQNNLKNITFKAYDEFVNYLREDAESYKDKDAKYIASYLIEKHLNFETIKLMCKIYSKNKEEFEREQTLDVVFNVFLSVLLLPMVSERKRILEKVEGKNKQQLLELDRGINRSITYYHSIVYDVISGLDSKDNMKIDVEDMKIYRQYLQNDTFSNNYKIRKDFSSDDFRDILTISQKNNDIVLKGF